MNNDSSSVFTLLIIVVIGLALWFFSSSSAIFFAYMMLLILSTHQHELPLKKALETSRRLRIFFFSFGCSSILASIWMFFTPQNNTELAQNLAMATLFFSGGRVLIIIFTLFRSRND